MISAVASSESAPVGLTPTPGPCSAGAFIKNSSTAFLSLALASRSRNCVQVSSSSMGFLFAHGLGRPTRTEGARMEAIASLLQDDPYLGMPLGERVAARLARRQRLRGQPREAMPEAVPAQPDPPARLPEMNEPEPSQPGMWFSVAEDLGPRVMPSVKKIQLACCHFYEVSFFDLISDRRQMRLVRARQVGIYLCKTLTTRTYPDISRRFGGRDHSTGIHAFRKIERLIRTDEKLASEVQDLCELVRA